MANSSAFDQYASLYDAWFDSHADIFQAELELLKSMLPQGQNGIEIGIGSGIFAKPLGITAGIEPSLAMAGRARERGLTVINAAAENIPLADQTYDFALMVTTICFLDDPARALAEIYRILKPGGFLLTGFVPSDSALGKRYIEKKNTSRFYKEAKFYSLNDVRKLMLDAGFKALETRDTLCIEGHPEQPGGFAAVRGYKSEEPGLKIESEFQIGF